jgi:tRNA threonylcarbamoyladenosine biosynthesis protein TsaB
MILLSVDTSGLSGSLAIARVDGSAVQDLHQVTWQKKAMHSEVATVQLQKLLKTASCELKTLTHLAVNIGPGSFTGLRVGMSLTKTLGYSLSLPVACLTSLEILAHTHADDGETIFVATKAVQNFFYAAAFEKSAAGLNTLLLPQSVTDNTLPNLAKGFTKVLIEGQTAGFTAHSEAKDLIALLARSHPPRQFLPWKNVEPLYIRASEAEEKLKKGLLKPV